MLYLTLTCRLRLDAVAAGLAYVVQTSTHLTDWPGGGLDVEFISSSPPGDGITELVTVRIKPPVDEAGGQNFVRVQVVK